MTFPVTLHPMLVHFPIVLLLVTSAAGLAYLYWRPMPELRIITWWSLLPGWIAVAVAVITGLFSQGGLPPDAPYRPVLNLHTTGGFALILLYGDLLYRRWLNRPGRDKKRREDAPFYADLLDDPKHKLYLTLLFVIGGLLVIATSFFGGQLVFDFGVNVIKK